MTAALPKKIELRTVGALRMAIGQPSQLGMVVHADGPQTTQQTVRELAGVLAALDGPMFTASDVHGNDYSRYTRGQIEYLHKFSARGINLASRHSTNGVTLYVIDGRIEYARGTPVPATVERATWAIQLYPSLVLGGNAVQGLTDRDGASRAAVGLLHDGRVFLAVETSVSMPAFAEHLAAQGASAAGYTDGGGSTALYVDLEGDGRSEAAVNLSGRRILSWITLEDPSVFQRLQRGVEGAKNLVAGIVGGLFGASTVKGVAGTVAVFALALCVVAFVRRGDAR